MAAISADRAAKTKVSGQKQKSKTFYKKIRFETGHQNQNKQPYGYPLSGTGFASQNR
jgi:hypothetical protein